MRGILAPLLSFALVFVTQTSDAAASDDAFAEAETATETDAYESWFGAGRYRVNCGRAAAETGGLMLAGFLYYWGDPLANKEDWDNPTIEDRVRFRALRFDTNLNTTNHFLHPGAGGLVYVAARVNGLGVPASFAIGFAQSLLWELGLEWREKGSINDLIYTPVGGLSFGEGIYQLGEYLNSAPKPGIGQKIAEWTFGFPRRIHRALDGDGERIPVELPPDSLGFSSAFGHAFALRYSPSILMNDLGESQTMHSARADIEVTAMPYFLAHRSFSQVFANANFTETNLRLGWANTGFVEGDLQMRATLFGHYAQTFDEPTTNDGHAFMVGAGTGFRFQHSEWLRRVDQLSAVHVFGPQAQLWIREGVLLARFGGEAYFDFASIESLAFPELVDDLGISGWKSVLQRRGYQYMVGPWTRFRADAMVGPLSLGFSVGYGYYGSVEGADRYQESLTRDAHGTESVLETDVHGGLRFGIVQLGAGLRERRRGSTLADQLVRRLDRDAYLEFGLMF